MKPRDLLRLIWANLVRMRGRVVMTGMGVLIGTAAIIVLIALATGLQQSTMGGLSDFGPINQITVLPGAYMQAFGGEGAGFRSDAILTPKKLEGFSRIDGVVTVTPVEQFLGSKTLRFNRLVGSSSILGIDPRAVRDMGIEMERGSDRLNRDTVIVGARVAETFADPRRRESGAENAPDLFGQTLTLEMTRTNDEDRDETRIVKLRVGGVLKERGGQDDNSIFLDIDTFEDLNAWSTGKRVDRRALGYSQAILIVNDPKLMLQIESSLITNEGFYAYSARSTLAALNMIFAIIQAVFGGIGAIALIVAAIGIANTMVMSILERTREIGLMKAVGATNRDVMSIFIGEAGAIGVLGGIGGVVFGIAVSKVIDLIAMAYINAELAASGATSSGGAESIAVIPLWLPIFAVAFALVIGLISGIYPALRAVQLNPVTALKYE
ncbi:MAG: ABC transporter permease [Anaerolineae bacterium]|nr:ABC transporter permease [Anaerolineae bacterium]